MQGCDLPSSVLCLEQYQCLKQYQCLYSVAVDYHLLNA